MDENRFIWGCFHIWFLWGHTSLFPLLILLILLFIQCNLKYFRPLVHNGENNVFVTYDHSDVWNQWCWEAIWWAFAQRPAAVNKSDLCPERGTYWSRDRSIYSRGLAPSGLYTNLPPLRSIQIDQSTADITANEIRRAIVPSSLPEMIFLMNCTGGFDYDFSLQCIVGVFLLFLKHQRHTLLRSLKIIYFHLKGNIFIFCCNLYKLIILVRSKTSADVRKVVSEVAMCVLNLLYTWWSMFDSSLQDTL